MLWHAEVCHEKWISKSWKSPGLHGSRWHLLLGHHLGLLYLLLLVGQVSVLCVPVCLLLLFLLFLFLRLVPAPLLLQFGVDKAHAPPSLLPDLVKDLQDFLLLSPIGQAFSSDCKRSERYTRHTAILDVRANATDEFRILFEHCPHFWLIGSLKRIYLRQQHQACVIEEPCYD
jgi:hypothetical protein